MTKQRQDTGHQGEQIALDFLMGLGYRLVEKNWRCRSGEIDLIVTDGQVLVFVEVKARNSTSYGLPQEAVVPAKQARIRRIAQYYLQVSGRDEEECRFDVVAIVHTGDDSPRIEHLRAAF